MNLSKKIVEYLYAEKRELERIIASLEDLQKSASEETAVFPKAGRRRGRKSMSATERQEVSVRMKKYWKTRQEAVREEKERAERIAERIEENFSSPLGARWKAETPTN